MIRCKFLLYTRPEVTGLDKRMEEKPGVPVLDGVVCGLIIAAGLVKYDVSTSKIRRYNPDY
jgi:Asp/Glu/hydantoin racemase